MFTGNTARNYDSWYETKQGRFIDLVETEAAFDLVNPVSRCKNLGCRLWNR